MTCQVLDYWARRNETTNQSRLEEYSMGLLSVLAIFSKHVMAAVADSVNIAVKLPSKIEDNVAAFAKLARN